MAVSRVQLIPSAQHKKDGLSRGLSLAYNARTRFSTARSQSLLDADVFRKQTLLANCPCNC